MVFAMAAGIALAIGSPGDRTIDESAGLGSLSFAELL
jgi:hypothetical protein